jgi:hypothetical protein
MRPRQTSLIVVVALACTAGGCYESAFPMNGKPVDDIDQALVGAWRCLPVNQKTTDRAATMTVSPGTGRIYPVRFQEDGGDESRYEVYSATGVEGLLNVRELADGDKKPWMFLRVKMLRPSVFQLQVLNAKALPEQHSPEDLRHAVQRLKNSADAFADVCVCVRAQPAE